MTLALRRMYAIFQKDLKDVSKNMYISTTALTPLLLAVFYGRMDNITVDMYYFIINFTFALVAVFVQAAIIAEEKEKNTLRGLMLSPASAGEILLGKSLLTLAFTAVTLALSIFLVGYEIPNVPVIVAALFISVLFYTALGTLLGLLTKTVMEASVALLPVMFVFGFTPLIDAVINQYSAFSFLEYMPNMQLVDLAAQMETGGGFAEAWQPLLIITAWFAAALAAAWVVYTKRMTDS